MALSVLIGAVSERDCSYNSCEVSAYYLAASTLNVNWSITNRPLIFINAVFTDTIQVPIHNYSLHVWSCAHRSSLTRIDEVKIII